ncbi:hypothetical protein [Streptomyces sp. NPDC048419]|uniref:hypothetical protein n=1 Tax=Streptomyces sp. NPDC048419 TaxID=3365547 RepID=UPI0037224167
MGHTSPKERIEPLRRAYRQALEAQGALFEGEGLISCIDAEIRYFQYLIDGLTEIRESHIGSTGILAQRLEGDIEQYQHVMRNLLRLRARAAALSHRQVPTVPESDELRARILHSKNYVAALGTDVADYVQQAFEILDDFRDVAHVGARATTTLPSAMHRAVEQTIEDLAAGKRAHMQEQMEKGRSYFDAARIKFNEADSIKRASGAPSETVQAIADMSIAVGATYSGMFAPVFGAVGVIKSGVIRGLQARASQHDYEEFVAQARADHQSLLQRLHRERGHQTTAAGTIARLEANFTFLMSVISFPASFLPFGFALIKGALQGAFSAYKAHLEQSVHEQEELKKAGEYLRAEFTDRAKDITLTGVTDIGKLGNLPTNTAMSREKLSAGLLQPILEAAVEQIGIIILRAFPPNPKAWLSPDDMANLVTGLFTVPYRIRYPQQVPPTSGIPGIPDFGESTSSPFKEKKYRPGEADEEKGFLSPRGVSSVEEKTLFNPEARQDIHDELRGKLQGIRFGRGGRWTIDNLDRAIQADRRLSWTTFRRAELIYTPPTGAARTFIADITIMHQDRRIQIQILNVRGGETTQDWAGLTVSRAGYSTSTGRVIAGNWYRLGSAFVFVGTDSPQTVRFVEGAAHVVTEGQAQPQALAGQQIASDTMPLGVFGLDVDHNNSPNTGTDWIDLGAAV